MTTDQQRIHITDGHIDQLRRQLAGLRHLQARRRARIAAKAGGDPTKHGFRPQFGVDYATPDMNTGALHRAGATFVCRYLASHAGFHNPKDLTPAESARLHRAGIGRVVVWETTADRARQGHQAGVQDAQNAAREARACGMPAGRPIYFAVDYDSAGPDVYHYFAGVASVLGVARTGAYGGVNVIRYLFNNRMIRYGWQTYAWSAGRWDHRAQLQQYSNDHPIGGVGVDYDRSTAPDFGQW